MTNANRTIEKRLVDYRGRLDEAISGRSATNESLMQGGFADSSDEAVLVDLAAGAGQRETSRYRVLAAAAVVAVIAGVGAFVGTRPESGSRTQVDVSGESSPTVTSSPSAPVDGTAFDADRPIDDPCPATSEEQGPPGTMYLGGPSSEQNLAVDGFLFSLPAGTPLVDVATGVLGSPVTGLDCGISGQLLADGETVVVTVTPPGVPAEFTVDVVVAERGDVAGVTAIVGATTVVASTNDGVPTVQLVEGVPESATEASVRFKKGEDVWELSADPFSTLPIELIVPEGEPDRFPGEPVDWVLVTMKDNDGRVVDVSGAVLD